MLVDKREDGGYVTPVECVGEYATYISRVREDPTVENGLNLWCVSDNLARARRSTRCRSPSCSAASTSRRRRDACRLAPIAAWTPMRGELAAALADAFGGDPSRRSATCLRRDGRAASPATLRRRSLGQAISPHDGEAPVGLGAAFKVGARCSRRGRDRLHDLSPPVERRGHRRRHGGSADPSIAFDAGAPDWTLAHAALPAAKTPSHPSASLANGFAPRRRGDRSRGRPGSAVGEACR